MVILNFQISQGSVATYLRWGGSLYNIYIENFLRNRPTPLKEFWKLVFICQSYDQKSKGLFFYWNTLYTVSQKTHTFLLLRQLCHMLADFHNSFTGSLVRKFAINFALNIPPHLTNVATLPCETLVSDPLFTLVLVCTCLFEMCSWWNGDYFEKFDMSALLAS